MYNYPYYIPNINPYIIRGTFPKGIGLFNKLNNSINAIKSLNWSNFINNTSKTLGIINQTIPIVKQAKPVIHNMKSMLKIASIFKDETDNKTHNNNNKKTKQNTFNNKTLENIDYSPTFFIKS